MYILFYSTQCDKCVNFINILKNNGLVTLFTFHAVNSMNAQDILAMGIKSVPCVVVKSDNNIQIFEGAGAFKWLENILEFRRQNMVNMANEQRRRLTAIAVKSQNMGPKGHSDVENSGLSDAFAYVDDKLDIALPKAFQMYGADDMNRIITPHSSNDKYKFNEKETNEMIAKYELMKSKQNDIIEKEIEQQLISAVYNKK